MLGVASSDITQSIFLGLSSIPAPKDSGILFALGNQTTCDIHGFVGIFGTVSACLYCCSITGFFLLSVRLGVSDEKIKYFYEPIVHGVAIVYPLIGAIFVLLHSGYYTSGNTCWIAPKPLMCNVTEGVDCVSGSDYNKLRWIFLGWPVIICFCVVTTNMLIIFWSLYSQNSSPHISLGTPLAQESPSTNVGERRPSLIELYQAEKKKKKSSRAERDRKEGMTQAILYILAYILCYFFPMVYQSMVGLNKKVPFIFYILSKIFYPLQGFFNFFIFIRPRIVNRMRRHPEYSFFKAVKRAIQSRGEDPSKAQRRRTLPSKRNSLVNNTGSKRRLSLKTFEPDQNTPTPFSPNLKKKDDDNEESSIVSFNKRLSAELGELDQGDYCVVECDEEANWLQDLDTTLYDD